ncbi:amidohydrolase/deacetylase family metallohydrolase [Lactovum odontotermitis]
MHDIVIRNAKDLTDKLLEVAVTDGKISFVGETFTGEAKDSVDAKGAYLSAGWIDAHVHCYPEMTLYYDYIDELGVTKGVTTVIDAGSTGENNVKEFYEYARRAETNVYAMLNISRNGIYDQYEFRHMEDVNEENNIRRMKEMPDFIVGIKCRMSKSVVGDKGILPLELAKSLEEKTGLPLMIHVGTNPPELEEILAKLDAGDIVTHVFNGKKNGILGENGRIKDFVKEAYARGVHFDLGHGTDSFNFAVAREALKEGVKCRTVSTDTYIRNRKNGPVYDLATTLTKLLHIGYTLEELIPMVTSVPAETWHFGGKGRLEVGFDGDLTLFKVTDEHVPLEDSNGDVEESVAAIVPTGCTVAGKYFTSFSEREGLKGFAGYFERYGDFKS